MHLKATVMNTGTEEVLLEYFAGQLFEVMIRDESGTIVYVHSDRGFQRYLMMAPLHLRLVPAGSHTETIEIPLVYTRGAEKDNPLPPRNYTLTVYLTAAVQGHPSGTIDGVRAYTATSNRITISRYDYRDMPNCPVIANLVTPNMRQSGTDGVECPEVGLKGRNHLKIKIIGCHAEI
jgi:hypothetical protein